MPDVVYLSFSTTWENNLPVLQRKEGSRPTAPAASMCRGLNPAVSPQLVCSRAPPREVCPHLSFGLGLNQSKPCAGNRNIFIQTLTAEARVELGSSALYRKATCSKIGFGISSMFSNRLQFVSDIFLFTCIYKLGFTLSRILSPQGRLSLFTSAPQLPELSGWR